MDTPNDYYTVLGVDSKASASTIKAAFKKLALQYHPDVYKGDDAQERMRRLLQAYQTLSDPAARKEYDARRTGGRVASAGSAVASDSYRAAGAPAESGRYAFPDLSVPQAGHLVLKLADIVYQLTPAQAENLKWEGMLRGVMADPAASSSGAFYTCHRCQHRWSESAHANKRAGLPSNCPDCHAQDWAEYLLLRCVHCHAVFESTEIHDPLRGYSLYHPYELFPLCPHCRRSQWCPAENGRVSSLRAAAARRNALFLSSLVGACLVLVVLIALVLLRG
ncbi:MAG TPA: DnaJ domain-containing protein [Ktedonobacteraceae bacterium]|nr:DnaJ domain-containing protein [Ktedonobacteraceae bacterium]